MDVQTPCLGMPRRKGHRFLLTQSAWSIVHGIQVWCALMLHRAPWTRQSGLLTLTGAVATANHQPTSAQGTQSSSSRWARLRGAAVFAGLGSTGTHRVPQRLCCSLEHCLWLVSGILTGYCLHVAALQSVVLCMRRPSRGQQGWCANVITTPHQPLPLPSPRDAGAGPCTAASIHKDQGQRESQAPQQVRGEAYTYM